MRFDTRLAVVVRADLLTWQKLNVTAFTTSGLATLPDMMGSAYVDGSGRSYLPMIRQPLRVHQADAEEIAKVFQRALAADLTCAIYTVDLFKTSHDAANRAAIARLPTDALVLAGFSLFGPRGQVDDVLRGVSLHD